MSERVKDQPSTSWWIEPEDNFENRVKEVIDTQGSSFSGNAADLTGGPLPNAVFPLILPAISGANLTGIDAAKIANGSVSNTEYQYIDGVTSNIQIQLNAKQASLEYTAENITNKDTDTALAANSDTKYASQKAVKAYVDGSLAGKQNSITFGANVQTALGVAIGSPGSPVLNGGAGGTPSSVTLTNGTGYVFANLVSKPTTLSGYGITNAAPIASPTFTGTVTIPTPFTLGAVSVTATGAELNYVAGVTSAIQTQLNAKAPLASPAFSGAPTISVGQTTSAATDLLINPTTKASGNLIDLQVNSVSKFKVDFSGIVTAGSGIIAGGSITNAAAGRYYWSGKTALASPSDGVITLSTIGEGDFGRLQLGGTTSSFPSIKRSAATLAFRLADDSADTGISAAGGTFSGTVTTNTITGAAANMTITSGTGNSRTMTLQTTTSGGVATDALTISNTQAVTITGGVIGRTTQTNTPGSSVFQDGNGYWGIRTPTTATPGMAFDTWSGSALVQALKLGADQSATFAGQVTQNGLLTVTQGTTSTGLIASAGGSNTGSNATSAVDLSWTLNTSGSPDVFALRVTDTARGVSTKLFNIYGGASGTTSEFSIDRSGNVFSASTAQVVYAVNVTNAGLGTGSVTGLLSLIRGNVEAAGFSETGGIYIPNNTGVLHFGANFATGVSRISDGLVAIGTGATGSFAGNLKLTDLTAVGNTILGAGTSIKNIRHGISGAMVLGSVTVTDAGCTANTRYFFSAHTLGTISIPGGYYASTRNAGTSFVITSSQATETSTIDWVAVEP